MRSAIAKVPGVKNVDVSLEEKFIRFTYDAKTTSIQTLMKAMLGEKERFPSRLVLQLEDPKAGPEAVEKARISLAAVAGVRAMSLPDKDGVVLITFHLDKNTLLGEVLKAAKDIGLPLLDPKRKSPSR